MSPKVSSLPFVCALCACAALVVALPTSDFASVDEIIDEVPLYAVVEASTFARLSFVVVSSAGHSRSPINYAARTTRTSSNRPTCRTCTRVFQRRVQSIGSLPRHATWGHRIASGACWSAEASPGLMLHPAFDQDGTDQATRHSLLVIVTSLCTAGPRDHGFSRAVS